MTLVPALGIDYGARRIGVAASDPLGITTTALEVIEERTPEKAADRIGELARERDVGILVFGMPYNMDGTEHDAAKAVRAFAEICTARTGLPVEFVDERLTTLEAEGILKRAGMHDWRKRRRHVDRIAAAVILRTWLETRA